MKKVIITLLYSCIFLSPFSLADKGVEKIPGYTYGSKKLAVAPYTLSDLEVLKATVLFTEEDVKWLRKSRKVLEPQAEKYLILGMVLSVPIPIC